MKNVVVLISSFLIFSCSKNKEEDIKSPVTEKGFFTKCKELVIESDEMKSIRKEEYLKNMTLNYNEYDQVLEFFSQKKNPFVLEKKGSIYKIINSQIDDAGSKLYNYEDEETIKYFYVTEDNYYIYSFSYTNKKDIVFQGLRRIEKGFFKTDIHDLIFEKNKLIKENLIGRYSTDFFEEDDIQKFEFSNKVNGDRITNTFNLGKIKNF